MYRLTRKNDKLTNGMGKSGGSAPIHRELLLIVGLDWTSLWETLDDFDGAVELGVDELVRVHGLCEEFRRLG